MNNMIVKFKNAANEKVILDSTILPVIRSSYEAISSQNQYTSIKTDAVNLSSCLRDDETRSALLESFCSKSFLLCAKNVVTILSVCRMTSR
eukprot:scaffold6683_cov103-Cylindrotheca_fusiformis.AAC.2